MSSHRYRLIAPIKQAALFLGLQPEALFRHAGLSVRLLDDAEASLDPAQVFQLWHSVEALVSDRAGAVALGRQMAHVPFGAALVAFACADTIRTGLDRLALFKPITAPVRIEHGDNAAGYRVRFRPLTDALTLTPMMADFELAFFVELCRLLTGREIVPLHAAAPEASAALPAFLGCAVAPGDWPELVLSPEHMALPLISENASVWHGLEPVLRRQLLELERGAPMADKVRAELMELLPSGRSSVDDVSARLGLGRRNLQRMLSDEGTSFRAVLDGLRQELAVSYLRNEGLKVEEVSYLLAFADPNSFYRAFRGWTGMTPAEARRLH